MARLIRASEVGEYRFCARAWWLRHVEGLEPAGQARRQTGEVAHRGHSAGLRASAFWLLAGLLLLAAALVLTLF